MREQDPTPIPLASKLLKRVVDPCYRLFDWLFTSQYNPLYRSGTLAVGFLIVLLVTGLYLSFFYSVSIPYQSVAGINEQLWLGRWVRSLHRYATVATLIAVGFHVLQLLSQGKTWGPRTLAWFVGVVLCLMLLVSAWTGYVMVWDQHGQLLAISGAAVLGTLPFLHDVVLHAFDGVTPIEPGFFFMNLFLHVAVPVMMIVFLWVHTSRLSRAVWLPARKVLYGSIVALLLLSLLAPSPLLEQANLLRIVGRIPVDLCATSWILILDRFGSWAAWAALSVPPIILFSIPLWWRPRANRAREKSRVEIEKCTGCTQCALDCPYEAITMVPRNDGRRLVAAVNAQYCVSCGICAASCTEYAVGPPMRTGYEQEMLFAEIFTQDGESKNDLDLIIVACTNNSQLCAQLTKYTAQDSAARFLAVECCGCLHSNALWNVLQRSKGVALIGCPARNCFNRDGLELLSQRIYEKRVPFLNRDIDRNRILISAYSGAEGAAVRDSLAQFRKNLSNTPSVVGRASYFFQNLRLFIATAALLLIVAVISQFPVGAPAKYGIVRIAGVLPSRASKNCRLPTESEIASVPFHMRPKEVCDIHPISYQVSLTVDGKLVSEVPVGELGEKTDRPLYLNSDFRAAPGAHTLQVALRHLGEGDATVNTRCSAEVIIHPAEIYLVRYLRDEGTLVCGSSFGRK